MSAHPGSMTVVHGLDRLDPALGRLFVVVGVFDGLHVGHQYLLQHLVLEAGRRDATPTVLTFDHHPDEILTGSAPALLCDPEERLARLRAAGVGVTIVQHFDVALRETSFEAFVRRIARRVELAGFLMTPDSAFGYERRGTPETVARLGAQLGYDVAVVAPFTVDGGPVSSSEIRRAIASGDLGTAQRLLGRPVSVVGRVEPDAAGPPCLAFELPVVLPPAGRYPVRIEPAVIEGATAGPAGLPPEQAGLPPEPAGPAPEQALAAIDGQVVRLIGDVEQGRRIRLTFA